MDRYTPHFAEIARLCYVAYEAGERALADVHRLAVTREDAKLLGDQIKTAMESALRARDIAQRFSQLEGE